MTSRKIRDLTCETAVIEAAAWDQGRTDSLIYATWRSIGKIAKRAITYSLFLTVYMTTAISDIKASSLQMLAFRVTRGTMWTSIRLLWWMLPLSKNNWRR